MEATDKRLVVVPRPWVGQVASKLLRWGWPAAFLVLLAGCGGGPTNTALPVLSGQAILGATLTVTSGTWTSTGTPPITYYYEWDRCTPPSGTCTAITGATATTYQLTSADVSQNIQVVVKASDSSGLGYATSNTLGPVTAPPANVSRPTITGIAGVGLTLSSSTGTWQYGPTSFAYSWRRCDSAGASCIAISGATASTYVLTPTDSASTLRVLVTATNSTGSTVARSDPTGAVPAQQTCPIAGATDTWTGGAGTTNWSTPGNWSNNAVPTASDFACLPIDTPGNTSISVPALSLARLASFKAVTISSNLSTTGGTDFEAAVTWQTGNVSGPLTIGPFATVTVSGGVFDYAATTANAGSVKLVDGGNMYVCGVWLNSGRFELANNTGTSSLAPTGPNCGRIINTSTGTIIKTGTAATDQLLAYLQIENDGTVIAQNGTLQWANFESVVPANPAPGDNISVGDFTSTGTASIQFTGSGINNIGVGASFGNTIYDYGNLTGTITVPAGATLTVGSATTRAYIGGTVTGAGTLIARGPSPASGFNYSNVSADLLVPTVQLNDNVSFFNKPDATPNQIGVNTNVTVTGLVSDYATVETNAGNVTLVDGGNLYLCGLWTNAGRLAFANNTGTSNVTSASNCGRIINTSTGTIIKTGTSASNQLMSFQQLENDGDVTAQSGQVQWVNYASPPTTQPAPGDNISAGDFTSTGTASIQFTGGGFNNIAAGATFKNTIYDYGNLTGTITLPAGATLTVGSTATKGYVGGTVTGGGTLIATGPSPANGANFSTIAADLLIPTAQVNTNVAFSNKPDATALQIGLNTTVTLAVTPIFYTNQFINNGTIEFGSNDYFSACSGCSVTNNNAFIVHNDDPDGNFTRTFYIGSGTFQNNGIIHEVGYLPGVAIKFADLPYANVTNKGAAEFDHLLDPTWVTSLKSSATAQTVAAAVSQTCGSPLSLLACAARNLGLKVASSLGHIGAGACANVNLNFVVVGATAGACIVIDPAGNQGVVVTLAAGPAISKQSFTLNPFDATKLFSFDAGGQIFWRSGAASDHEFAIAPPDGAPNDVDGPAWCQSGSDIIGEGVVVTHCWNPADGVAFQLDMTPILREGVHSLYVGAGVGGSLGASTQLAYSFLIPCGDWTNITGLTCPPVNTGLPTIAGTPAVGQTLTAMTGTWASTATPTFSFQWTRCTSTNTCTQVSTTSAYLVTTADRGSTFSVTVTGSNSGGSVPATSAKTAAVP
jgi:hypothetical protein